MIDGSIQSVCLSIRNHVQNIYIYLPRHFFSTHAINGKAQDPHSPSNPPPHRANKNTHRTSSSPGSRIRSASLDWTGSSEGEGEGESGFLAARSALCGYLKGEEERGRRGRGGEGRGGGGERGAGGGGKRRRGGGGAWRAFDLFVCLCVYNCIAS